MDYVMVPVPEEHVVDVMVHVARLVARASVVPWTDDAVAELFDEVDEACRSVLSQVARSTVANRDITDDDVAKSLELSAREVRAIVRDVNEGQQGKREPLLALRETSVELPNGRTVPKRVFVMTEAVARALRSHERASLSPERDSPAAPAE